MSVEYFPALKATLPYKLKRISDSRYPIAIEPVANPVLQSSLDNYNYNTYSNYVPRSTPEKDCWKLLSSFREYLLTVEDRLCFTVLTSHWRFYEVRSASRVQRTRLNVINVPSEPFLL